jgi:Zn-dependent M28 family amino/carboxypeptidase
MAPLLPILGARMAGIEEQWLSILQLFPTVLLIVAVFMLLDIALSETVPGAYDNASGVAAVLSAAEELDAASPPTLDVWVLLPGGEETLCVGARNWARANRKQIDRERTLVVNVDHGAYGTVHYETSEGAVISYPMDAQLIELCEALAAAGAGGEGELAARPIRSPLLTDALPFRVRRMRAITVTSVDDGLPPPWYHTHEDTPDRINAGSLSRTTEFVVALARLLDREAGRSQAASSLST